MQSLSLSYPHTVRPFQFHSCIRKERIPWKTPRRHALRSQSLRWHYPNQVRSKIYLPLSLSHKLPLALFFSVFQYSTHLSRCQTSTAYCSLQREEEKKILIILSDGRPYDVIINRPNAKNPAPYQGKYAISDTATEVRRLRSQGVSVLGVFARKKVHKNE